MPDFDRSFNKTMGNEGGYSNNPKDSGGETYRGISRKHHPSWDGWKIIDGFKIASGYPDDNGMFKKMLADDLALGALVRIFYREEFWNKICGDELLDQDIADEMFDTAVIMGPGRAVNFLQRCLNMLNNMGTLYEDIHTDGRLGPKTIATLSAYLDVRPVGLLFNYLNFMQAAHFFKRIEEREENEEFARGWFEHRIKIQKV